MPIFTTKKSGIDIIINTEVWDMRTFKLLNTINSLDNCLLKYNHSKDVMYGRKYSFRQSKRANLLLSKNHNDKYGLFSVLVLLRNPNKD